MREKFWDLAGSKMGNLLKVQHNPEKTDKNVSKDDEVDYKADNQYASALKSQKNQAVSDFAQKKTIK